MKDLLFLAHRIPFPPDKGDKIRSFHELRFLSSRFRVHLGAFVDAPEDWVHRDKLSAMCASLCLVPLDPRWAKLRSLRGLLRGAPLTVPYYADQRMADWVDEVVQRNRPVAAFVFSGAMAQYAESPALKRRVLDLVDVDSQKWAAYAAMRSWPSNWIYRREARRLLSYERHLARSLDSCLLVSKAEASLFAELAPESAGRIHVLENGVDTAYFDLDVQHPNPYPRLGPVLVFTGAMDYWPNVDAVTWFAREVFPAVREHRPDALFYVVGSKPQEAVVKLKELPGVCVTGRVEDVRPYLANARLAVAPLRLARGIQNKVLEAMAMGRRLIASPQAMEGIEGPLPEDVRVAREVSDWIAGIEWAISETGHSPANRDFVIKHYDWTRHLAKLEQHLGD